MKKLAGRDAQNAAVNISHAVKRPVFGGFFEKTVDGALVFTGTVTQLSGKFFNLSEFGSFIDNFFTKTADLFFTVSVIGYPGKMFFKQRLDLQRQILWRFVRVSRKAVREVGDKSLDFS